jgi:hypothetical protein
MSGGRVDEEEAGSLVDERENLHFSGIVVWHQSLL